MTQSERRIYLINKLLEEQPQYRVSPVPKSETEQKRLLRALMNIRRPQPIGDDFLNVQDEYLQTEIKEKGITDLSALTPISGDIYLWQGDITTLRCDAIVNAANSKMLGCFCPCHGCIDNAIHTFSGIQLRLECSGIMQKQGSSESVGRAKLTKAYNLPCKYVLHTVGPYIGGEVTKNDEEQLASCYRSCLMLAEEKEIASVAFCCISTGEFHFPNRKAAEIAVETVRAYKKHNNSKIKVIFNVFKNTDYEIYRELLG
ncbi:MAG: protein-ADP-ribose hydrolase [Ruminiclostridium sp.]